MRLLKSKKPSSNNNMKTLSQSTNGSLGSFQVKSREKMVEEIHKMLDHLEGLVYDRGLQLRAKESLSDITQTAE